MVLLGGANASVGEVHVRTRTDHEVQHLNGTEISNVSRTKAVQNEPSLPESTELAPVDVSSVGIDVVCVQVFGHGESVDRVVYEPLDNIPANTSSPTKSIGTKASVQLDELRGDHRANVSLIRCSLNASGSESNRTGTEVGNHVVRASDNGELSLRSHTNKAHFPARTAPGERTTTPSPKTLAT